ncbi:MAG: Omp28-related outer membrane protein [Flavipsychrobacter sp.]|nr:Omp28-related outer membrane protein [Flavipsychrobacter sp.]
MKEIYLSLLMFVVSTESYSQITVSTSGNKYVLLETTGAAPVQFEPDNTMFLENVKTAYPRAIVVQHHMKGGGYVDSMGTTDGLTWAQSFSLVGYPSGSIDRTINSAGGSTIIIGRGYYNAAINQRLSTTAQYDVSTTYYVNKTTRVITANVTGTALASLTGDYHFNVYVVEDSVSGVGSGYDQVNYYNNVSGHMFFGAGNPIVGFKHRQVQRAMLGGVWGQFAVNNPAASTSVTKTFTYTVPANYDIDKISLISIVQKHGATTADREIMNAINSPKMRHSCPPPLIAPICIVTRDSATNKNKVVWEKTGLSYAKTYKIYRESSTPGVYNLLGTQGANVFSTYIDATSTPNTTSYRYKLAVEDSCGTEIPVTDTNIKAHRTVLITSTLGTGGSVTLNWNLYEGRPFTNAILLESVLGGPYLPVATLGSTVTTYTLTPSGTGVSYRLDIVVPGGCAPSKSTAYDVISSNVVYPFSTGIKNAEATSLVKVYPNPVNEYINIEGIAVGDKITLYNLLGEKIGQWKSTETKMVIDVKNIANGIYILNVRNTVIGSSQNISLQKQ